MTDIYQAAESPEKSIEHIGEDVYYAVGDEYAEKPKRPQPKRRYGEKTVRGIIVGRGENRQIIPLEDVLKLARLNCSYADMARFFGVKESTFKDHFHFEIEKARESIKHRLLESMIENACEKKNPTIQIWLSKNWLAMTDNPVATADQAPLPWSSEDDGDE